MEKVLKGVPDDRLRAYVIWDPIFGGDFNGESKKLSNKFPDKRASYFKDPESFAGNLWNDVLDLGSGIAWDVYLLYDADAEWGDQPPKPSYWTHQLSRVKNVPRLDAKKFTEEVRGLVSKLEPKPAEKLEKKPTGIGEARMKIEVLYFASCPTAKGALENVKAVLKERKLRAEVKMIAVETIEKAERVGFQGSPSIRINGKDLEGRDEGFNFSCRMYQEDGKMRPVPSKAYISKKLDALMQ